MSCLIDCTISFILSQLITHDLMTEIKQIHRKTNSGKNKKGNIKQIIAVKDSEFRSPLHVFYSVFTNSSFPSSIKSNEMSKVCAPLALATYWLFVCVCAVCRVLPFRYYSQTISIKFTTQIK